MKRYAIVRNARTRSEAEAYLPGNYSVIYEQQVRDHAYATRMRPEFVIEGTDNAGWTLDDYVIPRYASGLIAVEEIDLSHPVMKEIPVETRPKPVIDESRFEQIADRRIQARMAADPAYRNAESSEAASKAENAITIQVLADLEEEYEVE